MAADSISASWHQLHTELEGCSACPLRKECIGPVGWFGSGESPLLIVGEGPGGVEDAYGCPLIGPSGQLLDKLLWAAHMTRDRIITSNVIKCRPLNNRTPTLEEGEFCANRWLLQEIRLLKPKVIVALGSVALHYFLNPTARITQSRGNWFKTRVDGVGDIDCIATYHPSYVLRQTGVARSKAKWQLFFDLEEAKNKAWEYVPGYSFDGGEPVKLFERFEKRTLG